MIIYIVTIDNSKELLLQAFKDKDKAYKYASDFMLETSQKARFDLSKPEEHTKLIEATNHKSLVATDIFFRITNDKIDVSIDETTLIE